MKASEASFLKFLKEAPQFVIPIYQRTYSWTEEECQQLWNDVLRSGQDTSVAVHFVGSIVYIEDGLSQITHQSPLLVIDGQQRLTTLTLLLAALQRAVGDDEPATGFSASKIRNYFLVNPEEKGQSHHKLILSQTDKDTLTALVDHSPLPAEKSVRIAENYAFFETQLQKNAHNLADVCRGLSKLVVVDVALTRNQDNPQLIFESMNSTGRELSQADLIRNFILMGLEHDLQSRLYRDYWRPMELEFGQQAYGTHFDEFMRHYLTIKSGEIPNKDAVYTAFKHHSRKESKDTDAAKAVEALVTDLRRYSGFFCAMALDKEADPDLKRGFADLRELKVDVAYPFLLELYADFKSGVLDKTDLLQAIRQIESYVFRRSVCAIPTNSLNKTFATFSRHLRKDRYLESIKVHLLTLPSYKRFPDDDEFFQAIQTRDLYHFRTRSYWLRRLENHGRKEPAFVADYTIEHILPQNEQLSQEWQQALGADWKTVQKTWLHTLGNLTLTGYNSEYSDHSFAKKRDMEGGFSSSPLQLNKGLGAIDTWDENAIRTRAERLATQAKSVWPAAHVSEDVQAQYLVQKAKPNSYGIADHPQLAKPLISELFNAFRKEVCALDPCVYEEFLKLYIAYKAETNFVDVIPQAGRLLLVLNIDFDQISDPRGFCRNITGLGRWGNGNVEVGLSSMDELPYVIGLVRQCLETQLGDSSNG